MLISSNKSELETSLIGTSMCSNSSLLSSLAVLFSINPSIEPAIGLYDNQIMAARTRIEANLNKTKNIGLLVFNNHHPVLNSRNILSKSGYFHKFGHSYLTIILICMVTSIVPLKGQGFLYHIILKYVFHLS